MTTVDDWQQQGERISALVDGQLPAEAWPQTLDALHTSARARAAWSDYHLLREALQDGQVQVGVDEGAFLARLRQSLAQEAVPTAAAVLPPTLAATPVPPRSANDAHWKRWATLAAFGVLSVLAWQTVQRSPTAPDATLAQAAPVQGPPANGVLVLTPLEHEPIFAATQPAMVRDARLDAVLASQRAAAPSPSVFVRNAGFEERRR